MNSLSRGHPGLIKQVIEAGKLKVRCQRGTVNLSEREGKIKVRCHRGRERGHSIYKQKVLKSKSSHKAGPQINSHLFPID